MDLFICEDVNGQTVAIESLKLYEKLKEQGFKIFGMDLKAVLEFRKQYQLRCGTMPITKEKVANIFTA